MPKAKDLVFYREWFPLNCPLSASIAKMRNSPFGSGNHSDLCRYFFVNPQTATRNRIAKQINSLTEQGYIKVTHIGRTYDLTVFPKVEIIKIAREHYELIRTRTRAPDGESVAWENVLKVYLWAQENDYDNIITNQMIQDDLCLSAGVICSAKNVLDSEFGAIHRQKVSKLKPCGKIHTIGQNIGASAFWNTE